MTLAQQNRVTAAVMLGITVLAAFLAAFDVSGPARLILTVAFFLVVPGWALVTLVRPAPRLTSTLLAITVGLSVAVDVLVAQSMLLFDAWHPFHAFAIVAFVSAALLGVRLARGDA